MILDRCPCGKPWRHYSDPAVMATTDRFVRAQGPTVTIHLSAVSWLVPRDYMAQHGIRSDSLPGLGFPKLGDRGALVFPHLPAITCTACGMTSWHPDDVANRWCGNCNEFLS